MLFYWISVSAPSLKDSGAEFHPEMRLRDKIMLKWELTWLDIRKCLVTLDTNLKGSFQLKIVTKETKFGWSFELWPAEGSKQQEQEEDRCSHLSLDSWVLCETVKSSRIVMLVALELRLFPKWRMNCQQVLEVHRIMGSLFSCWSADEDHMRRSKAPVSGSWVEIVLFMWGRECEWLLAPCCHRNKMAWKVSLCWASCDWSESLRFVERGLVHRLKLKYSTHQSWTELSCLMSHRPPLPEGRARHAAACRERERERDLFCLCFIVCVFVVFRPDQ